MTGCYKQKKTVHDGGNLHARSFTSMLNYLRSLATSCVSSVALSAPAMMAP